MNEFSDRYIKKEVLLLNLTPLHIAGYLVINLFRIYILALCIDMLMGKSDNLHHDHHSKKFVTDIFPENFRHSALPIRKIIIITSYFTINSAAFLLINLPILNILTNILMLFALTMQRNNNAKIIKRIMITLIPFVTSISIETTAYYIVKQIGIKTENLTIYTNALSVFVMFIVTIIIKNTMITKIKYDFPNNKMWIILLIIPTLSLFIIVFAHETIMDTLPGFAVFSFIILVNILVFCFHEIIHEYYNSKILQERAVLQMNAYTNEILLTKESAKNLQAFRHDVKNHLIALSILSQKCDCRQINQYIHNLLQSTSENDEFSNTGNIELDSILNFKLATIKNLGTNIDLTLDIPPKLNLPPFEINIIISNILDNACDALTISEVRSMKLILSYSHSELFILAENTHQNRIKKCNQNFKSTKKDSSNHGIGINKIKTITQKLNGELSITYNDQKFEIKVIIPVPD